MDKNYKFYKSKLIKVENVRKFILKLNKYSKLYLYFSVTCDEELIEMVFRLKNYYKFEFDTAEYNELLDDIDERLEFKRFKTKEIFRVHTSNRFEDRVHISEWTNLSTVTRIKDEINLRNLGNIRNLKIYQFESFSERLNFIFNRKNRDEDYYLNREFAYERQIMDKMMDDKEKVGNVKDLIIDMKKIRIDFISHLFSKIRVKENFQYMYKCENWGQEKYVIEIFFNCFDRKLLSIKEQQSIINRIFPCMGFNEGVFYSTELLIEAPSVYNINNHKINIIIDIINKAKKAGFPIVNEHYGLMIKAIENHDLRMILDIRLRNKTLQVDIPSEYLL